MADNSLNDQQVEVNMPGTLMAQIDAQIGAGFVDRDEFIRSATRHYLEYLRSMNDIEGNR